ncbi:MAG: hypothetical protein V2A73_19915 [Pseudomonadota bacterium]
MSDALKRYRLLEAELRLVRRETSPGSAMEEPIIDEMASVWWDLTEEERELLDGEGPSCWPDPAESRASDLVDERTWPSTGTKLRRRRSEAA